MRALPRRSRAGFSLLEVTIVAGLLGGAVTLFVHALTSTQQHSGQFARRAEASLAADRALARLVPLLARSAFAEVAGVSYPVLRPAADGADLDAPLAHLAPFDAAGEPSRDALFVMPTDDDGDGWPDVVAGAPAYGATVFALVTTPGDDGLDQLELRDTAGTRRVLARGVAFFDVEGPVESGFAIPAGTLRVTLELRRTDAAGRILRQRVQEIVRLRNGVMGE